MSMTKNSIAIVFLSAYVLSSGASAKIHRDHKAVEAFKAANHCPSTGKPRGVCPGWIVDHVKPLCAGGVDHKSNMQWQTVADAKVKDKEERKECRK